MPIDPQEFAQLLGAKIAGEVPDVGGGPFGMARLAHVMHQILTPSQGERPGRPTNPSWETRCKVPMSAATLHKLIQLAEDMSTPGRKVSPMQVAAQLLEEAVRQVGAKPGETDPGEQSTNSSTEPGQPVGEQSVGPVEGDPTSTRTDKPRSRGGRSTVRRKKH
jgi:hypothetical protein